MVQEKKKDEKTAETTDADSADQAQKIAEFEKNNKIKGGEVVQFLVKLTKMEPEVEEEMEPVLVRLPPPVRKRRASGRRKSSRG